MAPTVGQAWVAFSAAFFSLATQLNDPRIAAQWFLMRVTAVDAAAWANAGYMPGEAAPLIADGVTPQTAAEMGQIAADIAGSPEEHAMQEIDRLVAEGILVDPRRVRLEQDPDDPDRTIVHIQPEDR